MTELQYFWGWAVYLAGAFGCLLSLWFIVGSWHPRLKRPLMLAFAVLFSCPVLFTPSRAILARPSLSVFMMALAWELTPCGERVGLWQLPQVLQRLQACYYRSARQKKQFLTKSKSPAQATLNINAKNPPWALLQTRNPELNRDLSTNV